MVLGAKRLGYGGETTRVENRGETTRGGNVLLPEHPVNVPIQRTVHLSIVIPANDTRKRVFGLRNFPCCERGSNLGPLPPEASANYNRIQDPK